MDTSSALCGPSSDGQAKAKSLRSKLGLSGPRTATAQFIGAHDVLSARIGELAGFEGIWASSLGVSAAAGRCDRDEITWMQLADAAEQMVEGVDLPVLLDGNDGCGGANVARLFAQRVARRGIAGLSIEDKAWPRINSLAGKVDLLDASAFAGKVSACRDAIDVEAFVLVARTDALIAGETVSQTIRRAEAYALAGADAVIVHSKHTMVDEVASFMAEWNGACPIIAIPTTYASTPLSAFEDLEVAAIIWANQLMRASLQAMRSTAEAIRKGSGEARNPGGKASLEELLNFSNCGWCSALKMKA